MNTELHIGTVDLFNMQKLNLELQAVEAFRGLKTMGNDVYAILEENTSFIITAIEGIVANHSPTYTDEQLSKLAEEQISEQINRSRVSLHLIAPIWQRRAIDLNFPTPINAIIAYNNVRPLLESYTNDFLSVYIKQLCKQHYLIDFDAPPDPMTEEYASAFLKAVYEYIDSISAQYKF